MIWPSSEGLVDRTLIPSRTFYNVLPPLISTPTHQLNFFIYVFVSSFAGHSNKMSGLQDLQKPTAWSPLLDRMVCLFVCTPCLNPTLLASLQPSLSLLLNLIKATKDKSSGKSQRAACMNIKGSEGDS